MAGPELRGVATTAKLGGHPIHPMLIPFPIALLVAPVLVLLSWLFGRPMNLVFHPFELFGIALAVAALALVSNDGESNWYEGLLLLAVYALLGIAVYFVPV